MAAQWRTQVATITDHGGEQINKKQMRTKA